jgi:hypothetical protein
MIETAIHAEANPSDKVIPKTIGMMATMKLSVARSGMMSQAFTIEEGSDHHSKWELAQLLFHHRGMNSPEFTYSHVFAELVEEQEEQLRKEEFWSDPCWAGPL